MSFWASLNAVRKLATSAFLAFLAWLAVTNSPLWPRDANAAAEQHEEHPSGESAKGKSTADHAGQKLKVDALPHVMDSKSKWELFEAFWPYHIPLPYVGHVPYLGDIYLSKFMILEVIAGLLICAIYIPLAWKAQTGGVPRGARSNFFEVLLTFIRDQVAKPGIGEHDADRFVPFLWTMFLFILFNNLLGIVPTFGSATGSIFVTLGLAVVVFAYMHGNGIAKMGFVHYVLSLWPHIDVPFVMAIWIKPLIFGIEWIGVIVRNVVLAIRLFANMFAGHMVLVTFLSFISLFRNVPVGLWAGISIASVAAIIAMSLLELFVAFLQAYIFTFLTALFMGMALHPEH